MKKTISILASFMAFPLIVCQAQSFHEPLLKFQITIEEDDEDDEGDGDENTPKST